MTQLLPVFAQDDGGMKPPCRDGSADPLRGSDSDCERKNLARQLTRYPRQRNNFPGGGSLRV